MRFSAKHTLLHLRLSFLFLRLVVIRQAPQHLLMLQLANRFQRCFASTQTGRDYPGRGGVELVDWFRYRTDMAVVVADVVVFCVWVWVRGR